MPPNEKEKRPIGARTPGPLIVDKRNINGVTPGIACPPLSIDDTPTDSTSQFCATNLAELDRHIDQARAAMHAAATDDDYLSTYDRLLDLYAAYFALHRMVSDEA